MCARIPSPAVGHGARRASLTPFEHPKRPALTLVRRAWRRGSRPVEPLHSPHLNLFLRRRRRQIFVQLTRGGFRHVTLGNGSNLHLLTAAERATNLDLIAGTHQPVLPRRLAITSIFRPCRPSAPPTVLNRHATSARHPAARPHRILTSPEDLQGPFGSVANDEPVAAAHRRHVRVDVVDNSELDVERGTGLNEDRSRQSAARPVPVSSVMIASGTAPAPSVSQFVPCTRRRAVYRLLSGDGSCVRAAGHEPRRRGPRCSRPDSAPA